MNIKEFLATKPSLSQLFDYIEEEAQRRAAEIKGGTLAQKETQK